MMPKHELEKLNAAFTPAPTITFYFHSRRSGQRTSGTQTHLPSLCVARLLQLLVSNSTSV